jgi:hypothetical protein
VTYCLQIMLITVDIGADLRRHGSVSDRCCPLITMANGPLMTLRQMSAYRSGALVHAYGETW